MQNKQAFTLIELLVVVLIIGILAAVALPQYNKAVYKSRAVQLYTVANAVRTAVRSYELENGSWPENFENLDVDLPLKGETGTACFLLVGSGITKKTGEGFAVVIGKNSKAWNDIFSTFTRGPYSCSGFGYFKSAAGGFDGEKLYCMESASVLSKGTFCEKVMGKRFIKNYLGINFFE